MMFFRLTIALNDCFKIKRSVAIQMTVTETFANKYIVETIYCKKVSYFDFV